MKPAAAHLIAVPFHDGSPEVDRGRGPGALLAAAEIEATETLPAPDPGAPEAARVFAIAARLAERVRGAHGADSGSGSLDAMGLALLTGRGWDSLRATIPGLEGVANRYSAAGGLSTVELLRAIALVADRFEIAAAAITAYEPDGDTDGRMARAAGRVLAALMALSAP